MGSGLSWWLGFGSIEDPPIVPQVRKPSRGVLIAIILAAILAAGMIWRWRAAEVSIVLPQRGPVAEVVYATGIVEPRKWAKVVSLQRRRIIEMCDCEGKAVRKGEVLARLDDLEERSALIELEARANRLKEDAERMRGLVERNVTSRVTYDDKLTQIREWEARIEAQRSRLLDLELRAPMDGVVLKRDSEVGEIAGTGLNDVLFWIGEPKPLRITAEVNEEDIVKVKPGQKILLRHDGFPDGALSATIDAITPKGDATSKTFRVYFSLPDDTPLKIGMSVEANIIVRENPAALVVPVDAIIDGHVFVVKDGRLVRRPVKTGIKSARAVEIVSGLNSGEAFVVPAASTMQDGQRVRIKGPAAQ
ncbi:MAG: efflux RND transporter periplasmic adaptor subunit [Hyphomicrobiaceae bacterium]|nr:MAG: efflux RND transporter periplasmic adaptor subunit [Hyphomicrobiaceae bacterium]